MSLRGFFIALYCLYNVYTCRCSRLDNTFARKMRDKWWFRNMENPCVTEEEDEEHLHSFSVLNTSDVLNISGRETSVKMYLNALARSHSKLNDDMIEETWNCQGSCWTNLMNLRFKETAPTCPFRDSSKFTGWTLSWQHYTG